MKKIFLYILTTAVIFTTFEPVSKLISGAVSPMAVTFIRFFFGGLIILPFSAAAVRKKNIRLTFKDYAVMAALGTLCIGISMLLLQYAVKVADSPALIAIIFSSNSVFTIILAALILKDKITPLKLAGVLLCVAGILVLADFKSKTNILSVVLAVFSALSFSLYTVLGKKFSVKLNGVIQTGYSFFLGSVVLLIILLITGENIFTAPSIKTYGVLLYLAVVVTGIGYVLYFKAMEKFSAMAASLVFFIKPILTPFAAFLINKTAFSGKVFLALALVLAGSILSARPQLTKQKVI